MPKVNPQAANKQNVIARQATRLDIAYIVQANQAIEGERAKLTKELLLRDVFCATPKAFILLVEDRGQPVGMAFYAFTYWASEGPILWVSQMYIEPEYRGGKVLYALRNELFQQAKEAGAKHLVWATHSTADRSNKLWERIGAKDLSKNYSFWVKTI